MILHPGVLSLLSGSTITLFLLFFAAGLGVKILRRWDVKSSSDEQLLLERRTYLVSTLVQYGLFFEIVSLFLFIYTADDIHNLLVGAMCATGSLNANKYGFPALYAGIACVFLAASWIALNHLDNKAEDYPLTRKKYALLLFVIPFILAGYILQLKYFLTLEPNVITSCCGVLFSEGGSGIGSSLASLPLRGTEVAFYSLFVLTAGAGAAVLRTGRRAFVLLLSVLSGIFFAVAVASIISFVSLYFYQIPTHHCPFDVLQSEYYYVGYPLYASLFAGVFFGVMPGIIEPFRAIPSLAAVIPGTQRRWALIALCSLVMFVLITLIPVVFSSFTLEGY
jgi:hypothetical protein